MIIDPFLPFQSQECFHCEIFSLISSLYASSIFSGGVVWIFCHVHADKLIVMLTLGFTGNADELQIIEGALKMGKEG